MRTRPLGKTGLELSELSLGTWGLSGDGYGAVDQLEQARVLERAIELGITVVETAEVYGRGAILRLLGERYADHPSLRIVSKVGTSRDEQGAGRKNFEHQFIRDSVRSALDAVRRTRMDAVLLHNPSLSTLVRGEAARALRELKSEGCLLAWGISAGDAEVARAALTEGADVVQLPYNIFFSRMLHDVSEQIASAGAGVLVRSVLAHGLLTGFFSPWQSFGEGDHRGSRWTSDELRSRITQLDSIRPFVTGEVLSLRSLAVRYALANEQVTTAVLGPRSVLQLEQLVREAGEGPQYLPSSALSRLPRQLARWKVDA